MIREEIKNLIEKAIKELQKDKVFPYFEIPEIKIESVENRIGKGLYGDYSSAIAIRIRKDAKMNPINIAGEIKRKIDNWGQKSLRIKVEEPGFINFFLSQEYWQNSLKEMLEQKEEFGNLKIGKNKKIQVEFVSANPTGPLTVGNARGGPFGDVLANVFKKAGFKTEKAYYINDYGVQILTLGHSVLKDKEAQYKGEYIDRLNKIVKEKNPYKAGEKAAKLIIKDIKKTVESLKIDFDEWFSEKELHKSGKVDKVIEILKKKYLTYEKERALWFKATKFGDTRDRVLVKKDKEKTYLAGDIAYHKYKFEEKRFDEVINIWGADHYGDVAGLKAGVEALGYKNKLDIILLQFVTLLDKGERLKMSKRKGVYVTMDELLKEVGPDIVRFFFLEKSADSHLDFDLSLAKEQSEKNPVYYIQYAYARIYSILKKIEKKIVYGNYKLLKEPSELYLIKELHRLPEIIEDTANDHQVQRIPQYATNLAAAFHQFYRDCRVIFENKEGKELTKARLSLIMETKTVLKITLDLMGISAPEKM